LRLSRGHRISGRVLRADGVTPLAGAGIYFCDMLGEDISLLARYTTRMASSAADGTFELPHVPPRPQRGSRQLFALAAEGVGWTPSEALGDKDVAGVEIVLRRSASAVVTVRDDAGTPRSSVDVGAVPRFQPLGFPSNSAWRNRLQLEVLRDS